MVLNSLNLKKQRYLNDEELLSLTMAAALNEKDATLTLLQYLVEVDARRIYATLAYSSLFEYVVKHLGLSESSSAERVNAVRLMRAVPNVAQHLAEGQMSVSGAAQIQRFIRNEEKAAQYHKAVSVQTKSDLVTACLGQSKREVEQTLLSKQSEAAKHISQEKIRLVTPKRSEIKFTVDEATVLKLKRVKEIIGDEALEKIFELALSALIEEEECKRGMSPKKSNLSRKVRAASKVDVQGTVVQGTVVQGTVVQGTVVQGTVVQGTVVQGTVVQGTVVQGTVVQGTVVQGTVVQGTLEASFLPMKSSVEVKKVFTPPAESLRTENNKIESSSRFIPIDLKGFVFERSAGQCEYISFMNSRRCTSRFKLQIDHIEPLALGGKTDAKNLRHLCANHNLRAAMDRGLLH